MRKDLPPEDFAKIVERLAPDGALRDIYVLDTTMADWQRFIDFIGFLKLGASYTRGDESIESPESVEDLFNRAPDQSSTLMTFRLQTMVVNCHFAAVDEIEFDIDPKQIEGPTTLDKFLDFMISLGRHLQKDVLLADEGFWLFATPRWDDVICSFSIAADDLVIGAAPRPVLTKNPYGIDVATMRRSEEWIQAFWELLGQQVRGWANGFDVIGTGPSRELGSIQLWLLGADQDVFIVAAFPAAERANGWTALSSTSVDTKTMEPAEAARQVSFELKQKMLIAPTADFLDWVLAVKEALIDRVIESRQEPDANPGPVDREAIWRGLEPFIGSIEATRFETTAEILKRFDDMRPPSEWK